MEECLFCKITAGEIPAEMVYENVDVAAFLDINPNNPGHTLVVPKEHYKNLLDVPLDIWIALMKSVHMLAPAIKEGMGADGINIIMNNEQAANQVVFHAHVHIVPRKHGDPHQPWKGIPYSEGEAEKVAATIKMFLSQRN